MRKSKALRFIISAFLFFASHSLYSQKNSISFTVSMDDPSAHIFHVAMTCSGLKGDSIDLKMPVWTPGYYQRLDFANNVANFTAADHSGKMLGWRKVSGNTWRVANHNFHSS